MLVVTLSIVGTVVAIIGIPASVLSARAAIRDGRRQQQDHETKLYDNGFAAGLKEGKQDGYNDGYTHGKTEGMALGVASVQAELYDWKNKYEDAVGRLNEMTKDRDFWRADRTKGA
jgi:flagellar biosynthesis/type III secretory pathway protein FliH